MPLEIPSELRPLATALGGVSFPETDEDAMLRTATDWEHAAAQLDRHADDIDSRTADLTLQSRGATVDATRAATAETTAALRRQADYCRANGAYCRETALDIEHTKYLVITTLAVLALQLTADAVALPVGGALHAAAARTAARTAIQRAVGALLHRILGRTGPRAAPGLRSVVTSGAVWGGGLEASAQGLQSLFGQRTEFDWERVGYATLAGTAGHLGAAFGIRWAGRHIPIIHTAPGLTPGGAGRAVAALLGGGVGGLAGTAVATVVTAAVAGQPLRLDAATLTSGLISGATTGLVGAAARRAPSPQARVQPPRDRPTTPPATTTSRPVDPKQPPGLHDSHTSEAPGRPVPAPTDHSGVRDLPLPPLRDLLSDLHPQRWRSALREPLEALKGERFGPFSPVIDRIGLVTDRTFDLPDGLLPRPVLSGGGAIGFSARFRLEGVDPSDPWSQDRLTVRAYRDAGGLIVAEIRNIALFHPGSDTFLSEAGPVFDKYLSRDAHRLEMAVPPGMWGARRMAEILDWHPTHLKESMSNLRRELRALGTEMRADRPTGSPHARDWTPDEIALAELLARMITDSLHEFPKPSDVLALRGPTGAPLGHTLIDRLAWHGVRVY